MVDRDVGLLEAGDDDAGEVFVVFDEEDLGGAFSAMENPAELGEEEVLVEGFLYPALGAAGELAPKHGGEDTKDDDGNERGGGIVAETLQGLPAAQPGHIEVEEDGFDGGLGSKEDGLFSGGRLNDGVAVAGEVLLDDGSDAGIVVADKDGAFSARKGENEGRNDRVGGSGGAGDHDVESASGVEISLSPDGSAVLLDDGPADGEAETGAAFPPGIGGLNLVKAVEDGVELVRRDAAAFVRDLENDGVGRGLDVDADGGSGRGELNGVREEIGEDLQDSVGVSIEVEGLRAGACGGIFKHDADGRFMGHADHGVGGLLD